jgi:hypothetical protein
MPDNDLRKEFEKEIDKWLLQEYLEMTARLFEARKPVVRSVADACFGYIYAHLIRVMDDSFERNTGRLPMMRKLGKWAV